MEERESPAAESPAADPQKSEPALTGSHRIRQVRARAGTVALAGTLGALLMSFRAPEKVGNAGTATRTLGTLLMSFRGLDSPSPLLLLAAFLLAGALAAVW